MKKIIAYFKETYDELVHKVSWRQDIKQIVNGEAPSMKKGRLINHQERRRREWYVNNQARINDMVDTIEKAMMDMIQKPFAMDVHNSQISLLMHGIKNEVLQDHLIAMNNDWQNALILMAMESACGFSHNKNFIRAVQREFINEFGAAAIDSLLNLEKLRLLSTQPFFYNWSSVNKEFTLTETNKIPGASAPTFDDPLMNSLVGYTPLTVRMAQRVAEDEIDEIHSLVEPQVRVTVHGEKQRASEGTTRRILVFFIGGVTLTECGMIRSLGINSNGKCEYFIGGTEQINAEHLIKQICPVLRKETISE